MLQVRTDAAHSWEVDFRPDGTLTLDGADFAWDITPLKKGHFHILHANRSYRAEVLDIDRSAKSVHLKINGQLIVVQTKDRFDLLLDKLGMSAAVTHKVNELKAPMPGLIVDVRVTLGQTVQKGDALLVLEAMKMENILKAPGEGTIAAIKVGLRDNVTKGQVLIQFS